MLVFLNFLQAVFSSFTVFSIPKFCRFPVQDVNVRLSLFSVAFYTFFHTVQSSWSNSSKYDCSFGLAPERPVCFFACFFLRRPSPQLIPLSRGLTFTVIVPGWRSRVATCPALSGELSPLISNAHELLFFPPVYLPFLLRFSQPFYFWSPPSI